MHTWKLFKLLLKAPHEFIQMNCGDVEHKCTIYYFNFFYNQQVNSFVSAFHDAVLLYALAVNETLQAGIDPTNGSEVTRRMWNKTFIGETTPA